MKKIILIILLVILVIATGLFWYAKNQSTIILNNADEGNTNESDTNEGVIVVEMPRGTIDEDFEVTIYDEEKAYSGTTLFADGRDHRLLSVNMLGEIVWEFKLTGETVGHNPGWFYKAERFGF